MKKRKTATGRPGEDSGRLPAVPQRDLPGAVSSSPDDDLGRVLAEMAAVARAAGDYPSARALLSASIGVDDATGRGGGGGRARAMLELARIDLKTANPGMATYHAQQSMAAARNARDRQAAKRILDKATSSPGQNRGDSGSSVWGVAGFSPEPLQPQLKFADVGGMARVKSEVMRLGVLPTRDPELARHYGVEAGGGVLLTGPPGCGKTLIARAAAGEMEACIVVVKGSDILHPLMGMAERNLAAAFQVARAHTPSVLFFDEIDGLASERGLMMSEGRRSTVNTLLAEMDGIESNAGVLIIGATNCPDLVDPALKRRGRFDKVIRVGRPDLPARQAIWNIATANAPVGTDVDTALLAELSEGLTGADITGAARDAVAAAWMIAATEGANRDVGMTDLLIALQRCHVDGRLRNRVGDIIAERWREALDRGQSAC